MTNTTLHEKMIEIQQCFKCDKKHYSEFGDYHYRKAEDILEALKPYLQKHGLVLYGNSEMVYIGDRYYAKHTVTISDGKHTFASAGFSREDEGRKKTQPEQLTASANTYARKMALESLLCVDDTKTNELIEDTNENFEKTLAYCKKQGLSLKEAKNKFKNSGKELSQSLVEKLEKELNNENS